MEKIWKTPINKNVEQAVYEVYVPVNSEDPIKILDLPEKCSAMVILHWEDTKVSSLLNETYNIIDNKQDVVNLVRVKDGRPWKFGESGNLYIKNSPVILWVKGGSANGLTGNIRVQIRIFKPKENK